MGCGLRNRCHARSASRAPAPGRYLSVQAHLWKQGTMGEALTTCVMPHARSASRFRAAPTEPAARQVLPQGIDGTHSKPACLSIV